MTGFPNYSVYPRLEEETKGFVTTSELRNLLRELCQKSPGTGIRFRLLGKMWNESFAHVRIVTDHGVVFEISSVQNQLASISDLTNVIQFELENSFEHYKPHFHYSVLPNDLIGSFL